MIHSNQFHHKETYESQKKINKQDAAFPTIKSWDILQQIINDPNQCGKKQKSQSGNLSKKQHIDPVARILIGRQRSQNNN